ncbi:MAG: hypothetical protein A3B99_05465 [Candidatus Yanofskybacteria bacterium RIFCSPHIGHO2_02_FULL_44_12b]|uniref:MgtC/SapB/SrpB/YhiD N-terminal domain-containing protein n=2 Tax=Candidatus Yanofskyibacteriota TaxID=1752733 RepID=A0A1F8GL61_9BACT|nr:MAG: MgtC family protein [Candidatus Yanofskybacteria bacterium GW2011_GWA2_44_9]OGN05156.1 MAG: hypothetical protein A2659_02360 [Candidatus Yanofskybacteria bacterium RIFCSPHIGHO2_01_FULL_44_24]OGN14590.1 MAG: hypothetical protein A3B99_05465 [Candidatus Yanofskybacteria bacterium RIFCSPHIGHO2_02_FULL_44_12b]OGN25468.1 MAG: hypothetical protein A2925_01920 [Candidatus Yanofskybacteria bacterium RIFCSPLOWO2_01_FULL_44_22]
MEFISDILSVIDFKSVDRLLIATLLGAVVGFERERSGKVAGMRTHALVSLGAALLTLSSISIYETYPGINGVRGFDYHLIANVVVGIGFIGAGAILRREHRVEGTTTAASLWVVAAIGIATGFGFLGQAIATTAISYLVLSLLWLLEKYLNQDIRYKGQGIYGVLKSGDDQEHDFHGDHHDPHDPQSKNDSTEKEASY